MAIRAVLPSPRLQEGQEKRQQALLEALKSMTKWLEQGAAPFPLPPPPPVRSSLPFLASALVMDAVIVWASGVESTCSPCGGRWCGRRGFDGG